jgi:hypothetical protein
MISGNHYTRPVSSRQLYGRLTKLHAAIRAAAGGIHRCKDLDVTKASPWAHTMVELDYLAPLLSVRLRELEQELGITQ